MLNRDQFYLWRHSHYLCRPQIDLQVQRPDPRPASIMMQRRVGMGACMGGQGQAADINWASRPDGTGPLLLIGGIPRPDRDARLQLLADIPETPAQIAVRTLNSSGKKDRFSAFTR